MFVGNSMHKKLKVVLAKFYENSKIGSIQDKFFKKLLSTKSGAFINSFNMWKNIPVRKDNEKYKLASAFERHLLKLVLNNYKMSFDPLKDLNYEALQTKRFIMKRLLDKAMSSHKRMFIKWA